MAPFFKVLNVKLLFISTHCATNWLSYC